MNRDTKIKLRKRLLTNEILIKIVDIKNQIDCYEKYMTEESFQKSEEVDELYKELRVLGSDLFYM